MPTFYTGCYEIDCACAEVGGLSGRPCQSVPLRNHSMQWIWYKGGLLWKGREMRAWGMGTGRQMGAESWGQRSGD